MPNIGKFVNKDGSREQIARFGDYDEDADNEEKKVKDTKTNFLKSEFTNTNSRVLFFQFLQILSLLPLVSFKSFSLALKDSRKEYHPILKIKKNEYC